MEIKLLRSRPETGAKSARLHPSACEWTAEAVNRSLFCFNCFNRQRNEEKRRHTRNNFQGCSLAGEHESSPGGLCCEDPLVPMNGANPQTHFISLFCPFCCFFLIYILSPFAIGAYCPVPGWMLPWAGAGTTYGINSRLGRAGLSPKPKPFQNIYQCN